MFYKWLNVVEGYAASLPLTMFIYLLLIVMFHVLNKVLRLTFCYVVVSWHGSPDFSHNNMSPWLTAQSSAFRTSAN